MISRTSTIPQRDISYGATSNEARRITSDDMLWLADAVAARGGSAPFSSVHALYASQMQSVYSAMSGLSPHWVAHDLSPATNWNVGYGWALADIGATAPQTQRSCRSSVATGQPLYGYDLRVAFWNSIQCERAIFRGDAADIEADDITYQVIGQGGSTPTGTVAMNRNYTSGTTGDGFEVTDGTYTLPFSTTASSFPSNVADWECSSAYAVVHVRSFEAITGGAYAVWAAVPVSASATSAGIEVDATDVLAAGQGVATHYGVAHDAYPIAQIDLDGLVPILAVPQNYRVGDLGWTFTP